MMPQAFDLDRFVRAQDGVIEQVRSELSEGRKRSHWMWFVFPQLNGLGHSAMARQYAVASLEEARAYLKHPILGLRLVECSALVNQVKGRSINQIFGSPDDLKFHSCMTLFAQIAEEFHFEAPMFREALAKFFSGRSDENTLSRLRSE